jgi:membrane protein DedA with SNARE-associated domain
MLGRLVGIAVLLTVFKRHLEQLERTQEMFRRFGGWLLAFGYFIPGVRHVTAIAAGSGCLNYRTFAGYAYTGGILWCTVFLTIGYYAGDRWASVARSARSHVALGAGVLACAAAVYAVVHIVRQRAAT